MAKKAFRKANGVPRKQYCGCLTWTRPNQRF